jgi:hypothetical protein
MPWRWMLDRLDSPWYGTARLFRPQQAGDWSPVFEEIAAELGQSPPVVLVPHSADSSPPPGPSLPLGDLVSPVGAHRPGRRTARPSLGPADVQHLQALSSKRVKALPKMTGAHQSSSGETQTGLWPPSCGCRPSLASATTVPIPTHSGRVQPLGPPLCAWRSCTVVNLGAVSSGLL